MAKKIINIGNQNNDGLGDPIRTAFEKTNQNFDEIYEVLVAPAQVLSAAIATASANRTSAERLLSIRINAASNAVSIVSAQVVSVDLKLSNAISNAVSALNAEIDARLSADRALSVRIDTVSNELSNEISNRRSASAVLETHINSVSASLNSVSAVLENHVNDVSASLRSVSAVIETHVNTLSNALSNEISNRMSAVDRVSNAVSIVSAQVVSVDNKLSNAISVLSANFTSTNAVVSNAWSAINKLSNDLSNEISNRMSAVDRVSNALSNEISDRRSASAVLETHINDVSASLRSVSAIIEIHVNSVSASLNSVSAVLETHINDVSASLRSVSAIIETHVNVVSNAVSIVSAQVVSVDNKLSNAISVLSANFTSTNAVVSNAWSAINRLSNVVSGLGGTNLNDMSIAVVVVQEQVSVLSNTVSGAMVRVDSISAKAESISAKAESISAQMKSINTVVSATDQVLGVTVATATATTAPNLITVNSLTDLYVDKPIVFTQMFDPAFTPFTDIQPGGHANPGILYYITAVNSGNSTITIATTKGGSPLALTTQSGQMRILAASNINDLNNVISAVSANLLSAKNNLQSAINVVSNALSAEIVNRASADTALGARIDGISNQVSVTSADLVSAKANLQSAINVVSNALSIETAARISAVDLVVSNALSAEVVNRNSAVNVVSNALSAELVNRISADNAVSAAAQSAINTVSIALSAEISNRISAINSEISNRNSAIAVELSNRVSADNALSVRIDAVSNQVSVTSADLVSAKANLLSNINVVSNALSVEISNRISAVALKANLASPTFTGTVAGVTATHVGLGNVTNESKATMFASPTFTGDISTAGIALTHATANAVTTTTSAATLTVSTLTATVANGDSGTITIKSGNGLGSGDSGAISITTGVGGASANGNSGSITIKTGNGTTSVGALNISTGDGTASGAINIYPGNSTYAGVDFSADVFITGGSSTGNGATINAGNVIIKGGANTAVAGVGGNVTINGGNGVTTKGSVTIGSTNTSAVAIGTSTITTTVNGTVKLPNVGTSGFVKLGTGGQLSADTNTYVTAAGSVASATTAGSISGFNNPTTASTASTIVYRDASGYITNSYFYSSTGGAERNASGLAYFNGYNSGDYYMRSYTPAAAAAALSGQAMNISGNATYATSAGSISGYNNPTTAATADTIAYRDGNADLTARQYRGQYWVDTSNTAYYMDPNGSSNFYSINVASNLITASETGATNAITSLTTAPIFGPTYTIASNSKNYTPLTQQSSCWNYDISQSVNAVTGVYKAGGGASGGWFCAVGGPTDYPTEAFRLMVGGSIEHTNGYINIPGSTRSPLFYDSDNTAYYANPAGTSNFNYIQGTAQYANYADLAENYLGDADYPQGTVLEFGGDQEITQSTQDMSQRIAGIVSDKPAVLMNHSLKGEFVLPLALQGRVPCRVTGIVRKGDMMVSNGDGTARAESAPAIGSIIGKALENFSGQTGIIEVVVGRV